MSGSSKSLLGDGAAAIVAFMLLAMVFSIAVFSIALRDDGDGKDDDNGDPSNPPVGPGTFVPEFSGNAAYSFAEIQTRLGPRVPGTEKHQLAVTMLAGAFESFGLQVTRQEFTASGGMGDGLEMTNIIGTLPGKTNRTVILAAHYDTRPHADSDPDEDNRQIPIQGANDGASGVAVVLELARLFSGKELNITLEFVLFDGEDYADKNTEHWNIPLYGSYYYANNMQEDEIENTGAVIVIDMIGDADLGIKKDSQSDADLNDIIWAAAEQLEAPGFLDGSRGMIDDHTPFAKRKIPAAVIIDFEYPDKSNSYWHTLEDTLDKISPLSLEQVGSVVELAVYDMDGGEAKDVPIYQRKQARPAWLENLTVEEEEEVFLKDSIVAYNNIEVRGILRIERSLVLVDSELRVEMNGSLEMNGGILESAGAPEGYSIYLEGDADIVNSDIRHTGDPLSDSKQGGTEIRSDGVEIAGSRITESYAAGLYIFDSAPLIHNSTFDGNLGGGLMGVRYRGDLADNRFDSNNDKGIYVIFRSHLNITGNTINNTRIHVACGSCGSPTTGYGLHAVDSTISIENNTFSWNDEAIYAVNSMVNISGNTVVSCTSGVHLSGSVGTVSGNHIHTNVVGIQDTLSTTDIFNNSIHDNQDGIHVLNPNGTSVHDNMVEDSLYGIIVRNGMATVTGNTISGSRQAGINIVRPAELRVSGNSFVDNLNDSEVAGKKGYATSVTMDNNTFNGTGGWNLFGSSIPADLMPVLADNTYVNQDAALGKAFYRYQLTIKVDNATVGTNITVEGDNGFHWRHSVEWGLNTATLDLYAPWKVEDPQGNIIYPELTVTVEKKGESRDRTLQLEEDTTLEFDF